MWFLQLLIWPWSYRPRAFLGDRLPTFLHVFELCLLVMLDHLVHSFDLPIGLRSCDRREDLLNMEVIAELLEFVAVELCSIIGYDGVGDSILATMFL